MVWNGIMVQHDMAWYVLFCLVYSVVYDGVAWYGFVLVCFSFGAYRFYPRLPFPVLFQPFRVILHRARLCSLRTAGGHKLQNKAFVHNGKTQFFTNMAKIPRSRPLFFSTLEMSPNSHICCRVLPPYQTHTEKD